jgi:hypothetical protein
MNDTPDVPLPATDADPGEAGLAGWFRHLPRVDAPTGLRDRVLGAVGPTAPARGRGDLRLLSPRAWPFGAWGMASAALLLLSLGAAVVVELSAPLPAPAAAPVAPAAAPGRSAHLRVTEDSTLTLFHDVETFDEVGLAPGDLIADWGR